MTAYRSAPPPVERPLVNRELARELLAYHRKHRRRDVLTIVVALGFVLIAVGGIVANPVSARPIASLGIPGAFGLIIGTWSLWKHRPALLDRLRTGIPILDVRRGPQTEFPTLHVDFKDGSTAALLGMGDEPQLARIEMLLRIQMAAGGEAFDVASLFAQFEMLFRRQ